MYTVCGIVGSFLWPYVFNQTFVAASSQQQIDNIAYGAHALGSVSGGLLTVLALLIYVTKTMSTFRFHCSIRNQTTTDVLTIPLFL